ncbi:short chain dehydrogenase, partial [Candidatus Kryptobacter tengchongensis]
LVNNAAIFPKPVKFWEITDELWDYVIDTNLKGQFLCSREVVKFMLERKRGKIINIASLGGLQVWTEHIAYNVAKAGLIMLTKAMAKALAPYITVNAIAPGTIIIPGEESGEIKHMTEHRIPLKRYGKPADITDIVVFLYPTTSEKRSCPVITFSRVNFHLAIQLVLISLLTFLHFQYSRYFYRQEQDFQTFS